MSELGSSAAVGIESVEWLDAGGGQITVRVTGRWRRRRGWVESRGPTMLVIEAEGRRQRFPATPEPPSLGGAAPGTWRLSFSVPAEFAHGLGGHVWLALGTVTVPLPVPESAAGPAAGPAAEAAPEASPHAAPDPSRAPLDPGSSDAPSERDPGRLEIERAWRRADAAERTAGELGERVSALERALERERAERALSAEPSDRGERAGRAMPGAPAERGEHAERAVPTERAEPRGRVTPGERAESDDLASAERGRLRAEDVLRAARRGADLRVPSEPPSPPANAGMSPAASAAPAAPSASQAASAPAAVDTDQGRLAEIDTISALRRELSARVAAEAGLRARTVQAETRLAARVLLEQRTTAALAELRTELGRLQVALERERARRGAAEETAARLRAELGGQRERSRDAHAAIQELRSAIELLRPPAPLPATGAPPATGARPTSGALPAGVPAHPAPVGEGEPAAAGEVTPDRLTDALTRLRQNVEPRDDEPGWKAAGEGATPAGIEAGGPVAPPPSPQSALPAPRRMGTAPPVLPAAQSPAPAPTGFSLLPAAVGGPTVEQPFRRLANRDAERAGRLLIGLLGAQRAAWPHAVAYDLVLGPGYGTVQVTVGERGVSVERAAAQRAREQVVFQIVGGPTRLARLFTAGPLRRLVRIGVARVRGRREGLSALRALLALPLDLGALRSDGVALDAETLFTLLAAMIEPSWTHGERFTISHADERGHAVFLQIRDGQPPLVSLEPPAGRIATQLSGPVSGLWQMFADGESQPPVSAGVAARGDQGPLTLVRTWANRAQSGHGAR